jgi:anti-anti-sigma regulatory factor
MATTSAGVAFLCCGTLLLAYWRGWEYARHTVVVLITLLIAFTLEDPFVTLYAPVVILIPPILALMLTGASWVVGSAVLTLTILLARAHGQGVYAQPLTLVIYAIATGGLILSRLSTDNARRLAEANARAEEALARAEQQTAELISKAHELEERTQQQQSLLDLVATLETPAIPLAEGVLFAPIVGHIDSRRGQALTSRLLHEASAHRARMVVLDIAGVSVMDATAARGLLHTAQALRLLGCAVTISGITADVALTLTNQEIGLAGVVTARNPQDALARYFGPAAHQANGNGRITHN